MMGFKPVLFKDDPLPREILDKFKKFRENGKFCDVTLVINNEEYHAHKLVLAASSPYFESVLKSHRVSTEHLVIPLSPIGSKAFQSVLSYFYTGSILVEPTNALEVLQIANFLLLFRMKSFIAEILIGSLSSDNALCFRDTAIKLYVPDLHQAACNYIENNFERIRPNLLYLEFHKLEELLQDHKLSIPHDASLASLIVSWVCLRFEKRVKFLRILMTFVEWNDSIAEQILSQAAKRIQANELLPIILSVFEELKHSRAITTPDFDPIAARMKLETMAVNAAIESIARQDDSKDETDSIDDEDNSDDDTKRSNASALVEDLGGDSNDSDDEAAVVHSNDASDVLQCGKCSFVAHGKLRTALIYHHTVKVHLKQISYKCSLCGYVCFWKRQFTDHLKKVHFPKSPPYRCDVCDVKTDKISSLVRHRRKHLTDRPFTCDLCSYRCRFRTQLVEHCKSHNIEKPYTCDRCRRAFAVKMALDAHTRVHQGERYLRCDRCAFRTRYEHHLAMHRRIHLRKAMSCPLGCEFKTGSCSTMEAHIRAHPQDRNHICQLCGKTFLDKTHLARHMRSHNSKPYRCTKCEYSSPRRDYMSDHMTRHHENVESITDRGD